MNFSKLLTSGLLLAAMATTAASRAHSPAPNFEHYLAWEYGASVDPKTLKEDLKLRITFQRVAGKTYLLVSMNETLRNKMPKALRDKMVYFGTFYHYASAPEVLEWQGFDKYSSKEEAANRIGETGATPQLITVKDCASLIGDSAIIFYTGYGISSAANTTDTGEIEQELDLKNAAKMDKAHHIVEVAIKLISNPEKYIDMYQEVLKNVKALEPTDAHKAISKMTKSPVLTENSDKLHQMTNVQVLTSKDLKDKTRLTQMFRNVKYLITVGLVYDESGVIKTFKDASPDGRIIAFNDRGPLDLSNRDYLVKGDVQITVPELKDYIR